MSTPEYHAAYYRANKHKWVDVNKDENMPYLAAPVELTDDDRVKLYSDWFSGPKTTPAPVFFSPEQIQQMADEHRARMEAVAASSSYRNALYLNHLKHYMATGDEMPGADKKWFGKQ
ncbi:hypothetical protein [Yaravirus sp. 'brasiliensis']|uniref:Uncharacterized protein n=1 Tax=Yaravirus sp. 'brasiliensis' TaxID=2739681 RepID=A0AAE7E2K1_9VIRU|nr:hypothetical protein QKS73_gp41 [Yaravirus brasiliensis]QKE44436.1 hypothetical protein [Yaravirus brasiliensis]